MSVLCKQISCTIQDHRADWYYPTYACSGYLLRASVTLAGVIEFVARVPSSNSFLVNQAFPETFWYIANVCSAHRFHVNIRARTSPFSINIFFS